MDRFDSEIRAGIDEAIAKVVELGGAMTVRIDLPSEDGGGDCISTCQAAEGFAVPNVAAWAVSVLASVSYATPQQETMLDLLVNDIKNYDTQVKADEATEKLVGGLILP